MNPDLAPITPTDLATFEDHDEYGGFGYIGHAARTQTTDRAVADAANAAGLTLGQVFLWANSRPARHFMDTVEDGTNAGDAQDMMDEMLRLLPELEAEIA